MRRMLFKAIVVAGLSGMMALSAAGPVAAQQSTRQRDKNLMRNLGIGLGAAAAHQAMKGNKTTAIVLGAARPWPVKSMRSSARPRARKTPGVAVGTTTTGAMRTITAMATAAMATAAMATAAMATAATTTAIAMRTTATMTAGMRMTIATTG